MTDRPEAILIAGPTASGKSALALRLAAEHGGIIVNADSMQVYRELSILTARPPAPDLEKAEHVLYGHVGAAAEWSVARWLADVEKTLAETRRKGITAIFVGGTGLYFKALVEGLSGIPEPEPQVRAHWRRMAVENPQSLHGELLRRDPVGAGRLRPGDRQRLVRALEVFDTTGRSIAEFQGEEGKRGLLDGLAIDKILVEPDRELLHRRIGTRVDRMLAEGAVEEVRALLALGLPGEAPAMKAIGVREISELLAGRTSAGEAAERMKAATRQYAKRQSTWFRHQTGADWLRG